jgi:hypothetical protein
MEEVFIPQYRLIFDTWHKERDAFLGIRFTITSRGLTDTEWLARMNDAGVYIDDTMKNMILPLRTTKDVTTEILLMNKFMVRKYSGDYFNTCYYEKMQDKMLNGAFASQHFKLANLSKEEIFLVIEALRSAPLIKKMKDKEVIMMHEPMREPTFSISGFGTYYSDVLLTVKGSWLGSTSLKGDEKKIDISDFVCFKILSDSE